jgi:hypothetical protein
VTADIIQRLAHDPEWTQLYAVVLFTVGAALTVIATTAWSARHD